MSKKCRAYSESRLGLEHSDNRKAFYAGWDAALREALAQSRSDVEQPAFVLYAYRIDTEFFGLDDNAQDHPKAEALYRLAKQPAQQRHVIDCPRCGHCCPQPAQPSKPWVGLTRDERMDIINRFAGQDWVYAVEAIEAKLREKNGGGV